MDQIGGKVINKILFPMILFNKMFINYLICIFFILFQFCDTLENIVKCTICHERLSGDVALCEAGHSACRNCLLNKINKKCPYLPCGKPFTLTQNLLAQELLRQLDSLKVEK